MVGVALNFFVSYCFLRQAWYFVNVIVCILFFHSANFTRVLAFYFDVHFKNYQKDERNSDLTSNFPFLFFRNIENHCAI